MQLYDIYLNSYRQYNLSITATLQTSGVAVSGGVSGQTGIQLPGDVFLATQATIFAIDDASKRFGDNIAYDPISISIQDANSGFSFTNGNVDISTFWHRGLQKDGWYWCFYPQQQLNVSFTWTATGTTVLTAPISVGITFSGNRYSAADFQTEFDKIKNRAYIT